MATTRDGNLCFSFCFAPEREGDDCKNLDRGSVIAATEERRKIKTQILARTPRQTGANGKTFGRASQSCGFTAAPILHFESDLQLFFRQQNRYLDALGEASACAGF